MTRKLPLLSIDELTIRFPGEAGEVVAVQHLSLRLAAGQVLALVGESGSGKSVTALHTIGLLPDTAYAESRCTQFCPPGAEPIDLTALSGRAWNRLRGRHIGMIFQEPMSALNPTLRCGEQIAEVLRRHRGVSAATARRQTQDWLERVRLPDAERIYRAYPHEISGGQRQRVMIAGALAAEPALLIADEPTTALDLSVQAEILDLLKTLQTEMGLSMLFITHDLGVVRHIADRVLVMQQGRVVEQGTMDAVLSHPQEAYTRALLAARPQPPATVPPPSGSTTALLTVSDLRVTFSWRRGWFGPVSEVEAVAGVSFDLAPGQTLGVVGESGSGKTTLGRAIVGLVPSSGGRVVFRGQELTALSAAELRPLRPRLQMIFQDPLASLDPRWTVGATLTEVLSGSAPAVRKEKALAMLAKVGLDAHHYDRLPRELSGGQRQRLNLARALLLEPELLICDEVTSALDLSVQARILDLLRRLQDELGFACLFISHDIGVIRAISDDVLVMQNGRIVEKGPTARVLGQPAQPYTRALLASELPD
jgi:ABC-type microcin C transport system duplicated ATPase subunit YejF